jgi:TonB family protein
MSGQYCDQLVEDAMAEAWKQWEGQAVNGEFRLGEYLGGSPLGAVFQFVSDDPTFQAAAVKLIAEESPDSANRLASWKFAASLSHPNLIRIFQRGRCRIGDAKLIYVVMERADEDLSQIIPRRALTEIEASEMLHPALGALAYLHANGLVHSRIKPANIMASGDQLKLSSDGLRRAGEPINDPTDYDAPEGTSLPAGDVWSLGMTLVEVLTQRLPNWDRNKLQDPAVPGNLPASLLDIARHCLRRDPARRWTLAEIAERLRNTAPAQQRMGQPVARNASSGNTWYLIAALILFLVSAGFVSSKLLHRSSRHGSRPPQATAKQSKRPLPEPRPVVDTASAEKKPAAPSDEQKPNAVSPEPVAVSPKPVVVAPAAPAPKIPATAETGNISGVTHRVIPDVAQKSLDTIRGTVRVGITVTVDASGHVTDAVIDSPGPSTYFANVALQAAQQWKFAPSAHGGTSDWNLHFEFSPDGAKATAAQSAP